MAENKTKQTNANVDAFINNIKDESIQNDCYKIIKIMKSVTKEEPVTLSTFKSTALFTTLLHGYLLVDVSSADVSLLVVTS